MVRQVSFNEHEAVLLLDAYLQTINNDVSRPEAVRKCSEALRRMAVSSGMEIDNSYRPVSGIASQMSRMESAYQGETVISPATRLFRETVEIYHNDRGRYERILREAKIMSEFKKTDHRESETKMQNDIPGNQTFPASVKDIEKHMSSIATRIFGNRFMPDQTLYEYLIEFLLVFVSAKDKDLQTGKMRFHDAGEGRLEYWIEPRMGLRRFIFYDKARKNGAVSIDEDAYKEILRILKNSISVSVDADRQDILDGIQDLLHGYAVVIRKRNWCAQTLLPVCPEMVLCDAMPNEKNRKKLDWNRDEESVDNSFDFDKRNFIARGGEVYYLHILQALESRPESKEKLETLLTMLMGGENSKLSAICNMIEETWENSIGLEKKDLSKRMPLSFIPKNAYQEAGIYSVDELINYLSNELPSITKIEILAKGIMFQIMRMLSWRVDNYLGIERKAWIVDMKGGSTNTVKMIAARNFRNIEDGFLTALNRSAREISVPDASYMIKLNNARKSSLDIFRSKGKELQCIIPTNGQFERFSLSEDVIRFLVLSMVPPKKKMTLNMFLEKLFEHYGIIVGPEEYRKYVDGRDVLEEALSNSFSENVEAFQNFLKATGFLRELSDATSIVVSPYNDVLEDEG